MELQSYCRNCGKVFTALDAISRIVTLSRLTINAPVSTVDTVSITSGQYESSKRTLRVGATSTQSNATLQVFVTSSGQLIGALTNDGSGRFRGQFSVSVNPQRITVRSSLGGQANRTVRAK